MLKRVILIASVSVGAILIGVIAFVLWKNSLSIKSVTATNLSAVVPQQQEPEPEEPVQEPVEEPEEENEVIEEEIVEKKPQKPKARVEIPKPTLEVKEKEPDSAVTESEPAPAAVITVREITRFDNVPATGSLITLMSSTYSNNAALAGFLQYAYGITDSFITTSVQGYTQATYSIANDGKLTISGVVKDFPANTDTAAYATGTYTYANSNSTVSYLVDPTSHKAYRAPEAVGTDASELSANLLSNVFGVSSTYNSSYNYTYNNNTGALNIYMNFDFSGGDGSISSISGQYNNFVCGSNRLVDDITNDINNYRISIDDLHYTYNSTTGELTVTRTVPATGVHQDSLDSGINDADIYFINMALNVGWNSASAQFKTYAQLEAIHGDSSTPPETKTAINKFLTQVNSIVDNGELPADYNHDRSAIEIALVNATGSDGFVLRYPSTTEAQIPFPEGSSTSRVYVNGAVASAVSTSVGTFSAATPARIYAHNTDSTNKAAKYDTSYVLDATSRTFTSATLTNEYKDFLRAVFAGSVTELNTFFTGMDASKTYTITFDNTGSMAITHAYSGGDVDPVWHYVKNADGTFNFSRN